MGYPGRHNIYEATIRRMLREAMQAQDAAFKEQHAQDSDEQLLRYLRLGAAKLNHTPWPDELVGGSYLIERFGSWERAVSLARLSTPIGANHPESFQRVIQEKERQRIAYRKRKAQKKVIAQRRTMQQKRRKKDKSV